MNQRQSLGCEPLVGSDVTAGGREQTRQRFSQFNVEFCFKIAQKYVGFHIYMKESDTG